MGCFLNVSLNIYYFRYISAEYVEHGFGEGKT